MRTPTPDEGARENCFSHSHSVRAQSNVAAGGGNFRFLPESWIGTGCPDTSAGPGVHTACGRRLLTPTDRGHAKTCKRNRAHASPQGRLTGPASRLLALTRRNRVPGELSTETQQRVQAASGQPPGVQGLRRSRRAQGVLLPQGPFLCHRTRSQSCFTGCHHILLLLQEGGISGPPGGFLPPCPSNPTSKTAVAQGVGAGILCFVVRVCWPGSQPVTPD